MVKTMRPLDVYTQLNKDEQMDHRPRDKRQVRNTKYEAAKAERITGTVKVLGTKITLLIRSYN